MKKRRDDSDISLFRWALLLFILMSLWNLVKHLAKVGL